jgi:hypothetical protein
MSTAGDPAASLQNLHDIAVPASVAWWPPAPGWLLVAGLLLLTSGLLGLRKWRRYRRNRYRRMALTRLRAIRQQPSSPEAAASLATLLKQTALAAWPRLEVASLSGAQWSDFLHRTGSDDPALDDLYSCVYRQQTLTRESLETMCRATEHWIRHHRNEGD